MHQRSPWVFCEILFGTKTKSLVAIAKRNNGKISFIRLLHNYCGYFLGFLYIDTIWVLNSEIDERDPPAFLNSKCLRSRLHIHHIMLYYIKKGRKVAESFRDPNDLSAMEHCIHSNIAGTFKPCIRTFIWTFKPTAMQGLKFTIESVICPTGTPMNYHVCRS